MSYIGSMKYYSSASTSTWIFFNSAFLLGNHFLNQFLFCILLVIIKQTYRQKGILIAIIPVTFEFYYLQMSKRFQKELYTV